MLLIVTLPPVIPNPPRLLLITTLSILTFPEEVNTEYAYSELPVISEFFIVKLPLLVLLITALAQARLAHLLFSVKTPFVAETSKVESVMITSPPSLLIVALSYEP